MFALIWHSTLGIVTKYLHIPSTLYVEESGGGGGASTLTLTRTLSHSHTHLHTLPHTHTHAAG